MLNPITVLIVDDNDKNIFTLDTLIKEYLDVHILKANSGVAALRITIQEPVDLILLDVQMPEMDGFETAKIIRSRRRTQHIPIVFLTAAYKANEFQQKGFAIGAADYLTKPINTSQLISRIKSYLRFIEQDRQHKIDLERKVKNRTAKLLKANKLLNKEILERQQIEAELKQEILERQQMEKALQESKNLAEKANRSKSRFLANMSHELRTPLNAIIGYSEILQEDAENLGQKECLSDLQKVHAAGQHLLGLIHDVLELSKIEAGQMDLLIEEVDINMLIDEVIGTVKLQVEKNANILKIECSDVLGKMPVDRIKLRQMLLNLLGNAAKFTKEGTIRFKIERKTRSDGEWMVFSVTDDGIGITEEQQAKLFQPFTQADSSSTRRYGGTGLGLSITKQFAEMIGGTIQLESEFEKGSTFTLCLPVPAQPVSSKKVSLPITPYHSVKDDEIVVTGDDSIMRQSPKEDLSTTNSKGYILIIDDAPREFQFLIDLLTDEGFNLFVAEEDEEGIQQAGEMRPDLILLDVVMPGIGGFEVCRRLKSQEQTRNIPIIFMTALDDTANIVAGFELGAVDYITKPFQYKEVLARINTQITIHKQKQQLIKQNQQLQQEIAVRKQAEKAEVESKAALEQANIELNRFKTTLDMTLDCVFMLEVDTLKFFYANQGAVKLLGYNQKELLQMTVVDIDALFSAEDHRLLLESLLDTSVSFPALTFESIYQHKNTMMIQVEIFVQCIQLSLEPTHFVVIVRNITEHKQAATKLQQAKDAAEKANRTKSAFLANMSHELRTPLNAILGYTQNLKRQQILSASHQKGIDIIHHNGEYLLTLINDILDLSKVEAGKLDVYPSDFHFGDFLKGITDLFRIRAEQNKISFNFNQLTDLPRVIHADEKRLRQILLNLLSNAIKFTKQGSVTLNVSLFKRKGESFRECEEIEKGQPIPNSQVETIRFQVKDTGVGIAPNLLSKIFLPFEQFGDSDAKVAGTGLGLAISKKLVKMMGGKIYAESVLGQGSAFCVVLDLPEVSKAVLPVQDEESLIKSGVKPHDTSLIGPTVEQATTLFNISLRGDIKSIIKYVKQLEQNDEQLAPFAQKILQLARQFAIKQIREIVKPYM